MAYVLLGQDSSGQYNTTNELYCPQAWQVNLTAIGGSICYQLQQYDASSPGSNGGQLWLAEEVLAVATVPSGTTPLTLCGLSRVCAGIRIRAQTAGDAALFQAVLVPPNEIPPESTAATSGAAPWLAQRAGGTYPSNTPFRPR